METTGTNMHICFLNMPIEYYSPISGGAIATIMMHTARELLAHGHKVSVLTGLNSDKIYPVGDVVALSLPNRGNLNLIQRRFSYLRGKRNGWDWPYYEYYVRAFSRALQTLTPPPEAVVVFNDLVSAPFIKAILPTAKVIVWLQNEQRTRQGAIQQQDSIVATHRFLTCSQYIKDWAVATHNIAQEQITVAHSGVDLDDFCPREGYLDAREGLRSLFIGRIDPNKGPDIAADAVALLRAEGLPICLTVAGGLWFYKQGDEAADPYFQTLKTKMKGADAKYVGHVTRPNVPELIRGHDVAFVLSRSNEPFGLVALEAMASGCAVIASNRGGLPEACSGAALLAHPDNFEAVVTYLRRLTTDAGFLRACKMASVSRAIRSPWSATADVLESVLNT